MRYFILSLFMSHQNVGILESLIFETSRSAIMVKWVHLWRGFGLLVGQKKQKLWKSVLDSLRKGLKINKNPKTNHFIQSSYEPVSACFNAYK